MSKKRQEFYLCITAVLIFIAIIVMNLISSPTSVKSQEEQTQERDLELPAGGTWYVTQSPEPTPNIRVDDFESIEDCRWSKDKQKKVKEICDKYSISFEMCIAQAFIESSWNEKATGDNGEAYGAWQIHPAVWADELARWGYSWSDMYNLEKACDVYCRIMKSHLKRYDNLYFALMAWRWGGDEAMEKLKNGPDNYALKIVKIKNKLR